MVTVSLNSTIERGLVRDAAFSAGLYIRDGAEQEVRWSGDLLNVLVAFVIELESRMEVSK
jgi:hypothetical protein